MLRRTVRRYKTVRWWNIRRRMSKEGGVRRRTRRRKRGKAGRDGYRSKYKGEGRKTERRMSKEAEEDTELEQE